ncbi:hypothetical protein GCM10027580_00470 [Corynebacterium faecale]
MVPIAMPFSVQGELTGSHAGMSVTLSDMSLNPTPNDADVSDSQSGTQQTLTTLITILSDVGGVDSDDITTDSRLRDDLAISSLNLIEAVVLVEDAFGVRIEDADVQGFSTVGDVITFVETHRPAA